MKAERQTDVYYVIFPKKADPLHSAVFDMVDVLKGAFVVGFVLFLLVFRVSGVVGSSMNNTFMDGDRLLITAITTNIKRGDVVIICQPWEDDKLLVKRVVGIEGDTIDIDFEKGQVYRNGEMLDEPYIRDYGREGTALSGDVRFPVTVPEGEVFVMGDNRNNSRDSRFKAIGFIKEEYIMGRAFYRISPKAVKIERME
ncbi:MAG: signal peptidase I [Clostridia bacterium]|nr:signal peptidase I [Clostridia bacterium]